MMRGKANNKGFSLVELIVVIAIMAVLVGILAPQMIKYVEKSRKSTDTKNAQEYVTAIETYAMDNEGFIATITSDSKIVLKTSGSTCDKTLQPALNDASLQLSDLKSSKWGDVTITVTVKDGGLQFAVTNTSKDADYNFAKESKIGTTSSGD